MTSGDGGNRTEGFVVVKRPHKECFFLLRAENAAEPTVPSCHQLKQWSLLWSLYLSVVYSQSSNQPGLPSVHNSCNTGLAFTWTLMRVSEFMKLACSQSKAQSCRAHKSPLCHLTWADWEKSLQIFLVAAHLSRSVEDASGTPQS